MSYNPNTQLIGQINQIVSLSQLMTTTVAQIQALNTAWSNNSSGTLITSLTTMAMNADGTPNDNDATPNSSHPISTIAYPSLTRSATVSQVEQALTVLNAFASVGTGAAVSADAGAQAILNALSGT
jgi:hypothetical protein